MTYTDPKTVISPRDRIKHVNVLIDMGPNEWSLAELEWDDQIKLGLRWNGGPENILGNPQSRGIPIWFIVPEALGKILREKMLPSESNIKNFPSDINKVRLRPLPKRILQGRDQGPMDYVWNIENIDPERGIVWISNPGTGHVLTLHQAHISRVVADVEDKHGFLELTVQMVFENSHVRLELM